MSSICPPSRPQLSADKVRAYVQKTVVNGVPLFQLGPVLLLGNRGYYLNSMGEPGKNDRNLYDDAAWLIVWPKVNVPLFQSEPGYLNRLLKLGDPQLVQKAFSDLQVFPFNFNTDPSIYRKGRGYSDDTKGVAQLKAGLWWYKRGMHRGQYLAYVQAGDVTVIRDGNPPYEDTGDFGIHIHIGYDLSTSSLGC